MDITLNIPISFKDKQGYYWSIFLGWQDFKGIPKATARKEIYLNQQKQIGDNMYSLKKLIRILYMSKRKPKLYI